MPWITEALKHHARCPACQRWEWREVVAAAAIGAFGFQRQCPRCRSQAFLVYRLERTVDGVSAEYLGAVELEGQNEADLRRALGAIRVRTGRLTIDDVAYLVASAQQLAMVPA